MLCKRLTPSIGFVDCKVPSVCEGNLFTVVPLSNTPTSHPPEKKQREAEWEQRQVGREGLGLGVRKPRSLLGSAVLGAHTLLS